MIAIQKMCVDTVGTTAVSNTDDGNAVRNAVQKLKRHSCDGFADKSIK